MNYHKQPVTFVSHVALRVNDLRLMRGFYETILGLKVLNEDGQKVVYTADEKTPLLSLHASSDYKINHAKTTGLYHYAILLPSRKALASFVDHLDTEMVRFQASDHDVSEAIYFTDPEGNGIEVYADKDTDDWDWKNNHVTMTVDPLDFDALMALNYPAWDGVPKETVLGHIHLHVSNLESTERFYIEGLGFNVVSRYGEHATFMSDGNYHHHIAINLWNGRNAPMPSAFDTGLDYYTIVYPTNDKRNEAMDRLVALGFEVNKADARVVDPAGNRIQLRFMR